jgi:hypothetical protein
MSVYQDVTNVSKNYLGPAAEQFIARQCQLHLKIEAAALNKAHLPELAKWMELAGVRFMDEAKSKELARKVACC